MITASGSHPSKEARYFYYALSQLGEKKYAISTQGRTIMLHKNGNPHPATSLKQNFQLIKAYLQDHQGYLREKDTIHLTALSKRLLKDKSATKTDSETIFNVFAQIIRCIKKNSPLTRADQHVSKIDISIIIAASPHSVVQFRENLKLIINHFPRYQLGHFLEVFDTNPCGYPQNWNRDIVVQKLKIAFQIFIDQTETALGKEELIALYQEVLFGLRKAVPIKMGLIHETNLLGTNEEALLIDATEFIRSQTPLVANQGLFIVHAAKLSKEKFDFYVQLNGGLGVALPSGSDPEEFGFAAKNLKKWKQPLHDLYPSKLNYVNDLCSLFSNKQDDKRFYRLIVLSGHGNYPTKPYRLEPVCKGVVAGFGFYILQDLLQLLIEYDMIALFLSSCYAGGVNSQKIHLSDGSLPCPLFVLSSLEVTVMSHPKQFMQYLENVQGQLFPSNRVESILYPRQLTQARLQKIAENLPIDLRVDGFPSYFPSTNQGNIPKIPRTILKQHGTIIDISEAARKLNSHQLIVDLHCYRKALFFSSPINPITIESLNEKPIMLLSRGSNIYHVIRELKMPRKNLEEMASATFNLSFNENIEPNSYVAKAFFIKRVECKLLGKATVLTHVMFKSTANAREVVFQKQGGPDFFCLSYKQEKTNKRKTSWRKSALLHVHSTEEAIYLFYEMACLAMPSNNTLLQAGSGRISSQDALEALTNEFWGDKIPLWAQFYHSLLSAPSELREAVLQKTMNEIQIDLNVYRGFFKETKIKILLRKMHDLINDYLGKPHLARRIVSMASTPLIEAVESNSLPAVKAALKANPFSMEIAQLNDSTALHIACINNYQEIAFYLIKKGAHPGAINRFNTSPLMLASMQGHYRLVQLMLKDHRLNIKGLIGYLALRIALKFKKYSIACLLIEHGAGRHENVSSLLHKAVHFKKRYFLLDKLLAYPKCDVNAQKKKSLVTPLHICIQQHDKKSAELLIKHGAMLNIQDAQGRSPLHDAITFGHKHALDLCVFLFHYGADINNHKNRGGMTPLHEAIATGNVSIINWLMSKGASWKIENQYGLNALEMASRKTQTLIALKTHPNFSL